MVRNNELKETDTKNRTHNFNDTVNVNDLDLDNLLLHKNSYENISIYHAAY